MAPAPPKVDSFESPDIKTDHARAVGHLGIGYMGEFKVPVGSTGATESAQMVGMRWWVQRGWGIDFALGTRLRSGTTSIQGLSRDGARIFAFSASAGVPFPLYSGKHYTFIVEPLVGFGYASRKEKPAATTATAPAASAAETLLRGSRFAFGAVAGAELQLGFIGLPQISIDATVGVSLDVLNGSTRVTTVSGVVTENVDQTIGLDTVSLHQPWDIFHSTVSVIYYL